MVWTGLHRGLVVRTYLKKKKHSVIATRRALRLRLDISLNGYVPYVNTIQFWIRKLEKTGSTLSGRGTPRTVRTTENVQLDREAIERSPRRSAWKHAVALGML